jgi:alpha 1,2-mannosyltransferase
MPSHINQTRAAEARKKADYEYGDSISYRNMCRYNSGFLALHPLLQKLNYYWRAEPNIRFQCDIDYDPFTFMRENNKTYSFIASMHENINTVKTLWPTTKEFMEKFPETISKNNLKYFVTPKDEREYNGCHFWSNFEIVKLDFYRSKNYLSYFNYLDQAGGFHYEV